MKQPKKGVRADAPAAKFSLIPEDTLLALYRNVLRCGVELGRGAREKAPGGPASWPFDAAVVAIAQDLTPEDVVIGSAENPALALLRGAQSGNGQERVELQRLSFADRLQWATGLALAHKTKKTGKAVVVFSAGTEGEAWLDALEMARAHRLPMIFVSACDVGDVARKTGSAKLEAGTEMPHIVTDGNDGVAMYRVAHEAVQRARRNRGATHIECIAFRVNERTEDDAVANMESYLAGKGMLREGLRAEMLEAPKPELKPATKGSTAGAALRRAPRRSR